jgi:GNAT superfamily N-acetyltransferase
MTPTVYRQAMRLFVRETLRDANILVADLEAVPDEPVGWIAYQDETVFYVRVLGDARRRGVASALVEASGAKVPAYLTPEGGALFGINYRPGAVTEDGGADARQSHARAVAVVES